MSRYRTIVADPPWAYDEGWPIGPEGQAAARHRKVDAHRNRGGRMTALSREGENERDLVTREYHMRVITGLVADRDRYGEALEEIRDTDPVDLALDPNRAQRIAKEALGDA